MKSYQNVRTENILCSLNKKKKKKIRGFTECGLIFIHYNKIWMDSFSPKWVSSWPHLMDYLTTALQNTRIYKLGEFDLFTLESMYLYVGYCRYYIHRILRFPLIRDKLIENNHIEVCVRLGSIFSIFYISTLDQSINSSLKIEQHSVQSTFLHGQLLSSILWFLFSLEKL